MDDQHEGRLVFEYFKKRPWGFFVEVGANHPTRRSQTWFLEQKGWKGLLVEPNPVLCEQLRALRPNSQVFEMALASDSEIGEADLHLGVADGHSALKPQVGTALAGKTIRVAVKTLSWVMESTQPKELDFVSIDVEGMELDVLRGFDLRRWQPKLLVIEDFLINHQIHRYRSEERRV